MPSGLGTALHCSAGGPDGPQLMTTAAIEPISGPLTATVVPPGSKSITNRALVAAALAAGRSALRGALVADDTEAMVDCLRRLGIDIRIADHTVTVDGAGGRIPA